MFYRIIRAIFVALSFVLPTKVYGKENLPKEGAYILTCNHQSMLDIPVLMIKVHRSIHFMAKAPFFDKKVLGFLFRKLYAFPVIQRTSDIDALRHAIGILKAGDVMGIFPQGRRVLTGAHIKQEDMLNGFGLVALKTATPIVPVMLKKQPKFFRFNQMYIGKPIQTNEYKGRRINAELLGELGERLRAEMNALLPEDAK